MRALILAAALEASFAASSAASMAGNGFQGERLVVDMSGDGPNTLGQRVERARDAAVAQGTVINGLALVRPGATWGGGYGLTEHYKTAIIGGPAKLVREISSLVQPAPILN